MSTKNENISFPWRDEYCVGIPEIDDQHQLLVGLINDLQNAMYEGNAKGALQEILARLVSYTEVHFALEERLLLEREYSGLQEHHNEHELLKRRVTGVRDDFLSGVIPAREVMRFLKGWLSGHIMVHDQAYARKLRA